MENQSQGRAAQYLRMSTEGQQYSIETQSDAIQVYAALRGLELVATYKDEGKSGLSLEGRDGLQSLIHDVVTGSAKFQVIIVYDVSRWGRFQDADEAAHYEFICRRAGIKIEYCAEPFSNDGSPLSAVLKGLKRAMAGEYSRELSVKVWAGQKKIVQKGFRLGASAGYGLRRQAVDQAGRQKLSLAHGEQKNIKTDRVTLVPGPKSEIKAIHWIYRSCIEGMTDQKIVSELNRRGIKTDHGRPFTKMVVQSVLTNEKYIGNYVWNRTSSKLQQGHRRNKPEEWIRVEGAFQAIIKPKLFEKVQALRRARSGRLSDEEILAPLRGMLKKHGYLSHGLIEKSGTYPTVGACVARFGSIRATYERLGYVNPKDHSYVEVNQHVRLLQPIVFAQIFDALTAVDESIIPEAIDRMRVGGMVVTVVLSRYRTNKDAPRGWHVVADAKQHTDIFLMGRLDKANQAVMDYFFLPLHLLAALHFNVTERKARLLEGYRCESLEGLASKLRCVSAEFRTP